MPVRQALGTGLLASGQLGRAAAVFRKDLLKNPEKPWSLYGLSLALHQAEQPMLAQDAKQAVHQGRGPRG